MLTRLSRYAFGAALSVASSGIFASVVFTDSTFNLAGYSTTPTFMTPLVTLTYGQCASCGNPALGLQIVVNEISPLGGAADVGFVNNLFTYDPGTQGAISSIGVQVDKNLLIDVGNTNGFGVGTTFGNTFRPLISQGGLYYLAAIAGPTLPGPTSLLGGPYSMSTGYNILSQAGLLATNFKQYDFATGVFGIANPNFAAGVLSFGLGQISSVGTGFTNTTTTAQYDNLRINVTSVPEPGTLALFGFGLAGVFAMRRRRLV